MQYKIVELNSHLFAAMERLSNEKLEGEDLQKEITRAKAITGVASQIIANGALALKVRQYRDETMPEKGARIQNLPEGR